MPYIVITSEQELQFLILRAAKRPVTSASGIWNGVTCFIVSISDVPRFCVVSTISCFVQ